ncbi:hypothetical protein HCN44_000081 [Aphidius gifuensis]|uniref:Lipocalin/cytosolic fatty-acid binding domain-containing protein n=1 Tax=Aphidius gifuensis TaxID=684658 RepID=A0A834XQF9_APHGI|nr:hypothetical protein HCN44_000081 [Aphidius gifuensis]
MNAHLIVASSLAQSPIFKYPHFTPMANFEVAKIVGNWSQVAKTPNKFDEDEKCTNAELILENLGVINVGISSISTKNGHARNIKGAGTPDSHKASSVFNFRYNISFLSKSPGELIVLDTDYKNYLVLMGIIPIAKIGSFRSWFQVAWIYSKKSEMSPEHYARALEVLHKNHIPTHKIERAPKC